MTNKRYHILKTLRLTDEEEKLLKKQCEIFQMKEAEYFRFLLSQKPNDYPEIRILLKELINEVNHVGTNINQIVKGVNAGIYSDNDKQQLVAYLKRLNISLDQVVNQIGNK